MLAEIKKKSRLSWKVFKDESLCKGDCSHQMAGSDTRKIEINTSADIPNAARSRKVQSLNTPKLDNSFQRLQAA